METNKTLTLEWLSELYENGNSMYGVIEKASSFRFPNPQRLSKPYLQREHSSEDVKRYQQELENYELSKKNYENELNSIRTHNNQVDSVIVEFIKQKAGLNNIPEQYRSKVYSKAYSDGHSSGFHGVYQQLEELVDIFN